MPKSQERCQEIREETKNLIIRNGFAGTKISDLSKNIGIAQGTIYLYFESKEDLYAAIFAISDRYTKSEKLNSFAKLPITAEMKIKMLSDYLIKSLKNDEMFSASIALYTQRQFEKAF